MPKKLGGGPTVYYRETRLSGLWNAWLRLNGLTVEKAKQLLLKEGIRANLDGALKDEWDEAVLTRFAPKILEFTGIDVERFVMIEAKRRAAERQPELADRIAWERWNTRDELIEELRAWKDLYGGTRYIALQMGVAPEVTNAWMRDSSAARPSTDKAALALAALARGFIHADYAEHLMFALMTRVILGYEVEEVFPEYPTFDRALEAFFRPYAGWTVRKIAGMLDLKDGAVQTLRDWKPQPQKGTLYRESVETVLRTLVVRRWPELGAAFDELRAVYKSDEEQGVWAVKNPLRPPLDTPKDPPPRTAAPSHVEAAPRVEPTPSDIRLTLEEKLALIARLSVEVLEGRLTAVPTQAPVPAPAAREPGETISGLRNCLTRAGFRPNPEGRADPEQLRNLALLLAGTRRELVALAELDPQYLRREVTPVIGPELVELIIGSEGLRHLLGTDEAWRVIEGMRAGMSSFVRPVTTHLNPE